ncbi:hypothetical protein REPUB_Repub13aG0067300 [Reevesia pubescens]
MQESQFFIYGNGKEKPSTGFMIEKQLMKGLYFNQSPTKVGTLRELQRFMMRLLSQLMLVGWIAMDLLVLVPFNSTVFILPCQGTISLWRSRHGENYVDGPFLSSTVRPTSETIVNHMFTQWIHSCCDLRLMISQMSQDGRCMQYKWMTAEL